MSKLCKQCGRPKHGGLCDLAELENGRTVHASRITTVDGVEMVDGFRVKNRWIKEPVKGGLGRRIKVNRS